MVSEQNVHPYKLDNTQLALAHNGSLAGMPKMKAVLSSLIKPDMFKNIRGTTDSEWIYSVFLSQIEDYTAHVSLEEATEALMKTLIILRQTRIKCGIDEASPVNLFVTNGEYLLVTRFVYDFGCNTTAVEKAFLEYHSLWVTVGETYRVDNNSYIMDGSGKHTNIIFASEPLTNDRTTWMELPEYSMTQAWIKKNEVLFQTHDLVL